MTSELELGQLSTGGMVTLKTWQSPGYPTSPLPRLLQWGQQDGQTGIEIRIATFHITIYLQNNLAIFVYNLLSDNKDDSL